MTSGENPPDTDPEWERILKQAQREERRDQVRALALSNPFGVPKFAFNYFFQFFIKSTLYALIIVGTGWGLWVADSHWITFDPRAWKSALANSNGVAECRLWNRFETQCQPVGMSRKKLTDLLGKPFRSEEIHSRNDAATYYFGDFFLSTDAGAEFEFRNDIVISYRKIPVTMP